MKEDKKSIREELIKSMLSLSTAGFGLVAALVWNDAIQTFLKEIIPLGSNGLVSKLIYALIVTTIAVAVTYFLGKMLGSAIEKK
ncbi:MAG: DUF5654 family protein [Candidatus Berkelbacteria bacterium]